MRAFLLGVIALLVAAPTASAVPLVAVSPPNNLLFFDSAAAAQLGIAHTIRGIDAASDRRAARRSSHHRLGRELRGLQLRDPA
jgi:hypothetical protein